jgi:predicted MFS family arabinose efflux permease
VLKVLFGMVGLTSLGNYIVLPFALAYGRRPAFLMAALCLVISTAGCAASTNFAGHLTGRVFQGLTAGATESVCTRTKHLSPSIADKDSCCPLC